MNDSIENRMERIKKGKTTKSQRKLIEYLESVDYENIIYLSITELAEYTKVAEATILRFCRSLGFNGYQEFKLNMAQELSNARLKPGDSEYIRDISENYVDALEKCRKSLSSSAVDEAIECILSAKTVCCFGAGNSYVPALELHNRLMKMGIYSQCERDAHLQNILISSCGSEDVMVLFSISGGTKDVVDAAALARTCGMRIIVVTSHDKSPLTRFADVVLSSVPIESPTEAGAMASKIIQLFLVDILCTGIYFKDKKKYGDCIAKSNAAVVGKLI